MLLSLDYVEDSNPPYALRDVVVGDRIRLRLGISISLSKTGQQSPDLRAVWKDLSADGSVAVPEVGSLSLANRFSASRQLDFDGTSDELQERCVSRDSGTSSWADTRSPAPQCFVF